MSESTVEVESPAGDATIVVVGEGACFEGTLTFWGRARVEGTLRGDVVADGALEVGPAASVTARLHVDVLVVEGVVDGDVVARERVEIRAGGRIAAAIRTPRLVLAEGAVLDGRLTMTASPAPATADAASAA